MSVYNRKGFTLIELLAVIIVLAVVTLLAVQAVLPQIEKARKNSFVIEANHVIDAVKHWYSVQEMDNGEPPSSSCVSINYLISNGYYEVNKETYSGYVEIVRTDGIINNYRIKMTNGTYKTAESEGHLGKMTPEQAQNSSVVTSSSAGETIANPTGCLDQ